MKELLKNKWAWAIVVLVLLNVATIGAMWASLCGRTCHHKERNDHRRNCFHTGDLPQRCDDKGSQRGDYFARALKLTPEQEITFETLRKEHSAAMKPNMDKMSALRKEVMQHLGKSETSVESVFQKIAALEVENQKEVFNHFNKMYALCTDSQKVILKGKLCKVMQEHRPGFGGGHPGAEGGAKMEYRSGNSCQKEVVDTLEAEMP